MTRRSLCLVVLALSSLSVVPGPSRAQNAANPAQPGPSPAGSLAPAPAPGGPPPVAEEAPDLGNAAAPRRYSFEEASLSRVFRLLAMQAGIDYIEPPIDPAEKISFELSNVTPLQAFNILAQRRGFRVAVNNGIYELVRDDLRNPNRDTVYETRTYRLRNTDGRLLFEGIANLLGMKVQRPSGVTQGFPVPQSISASSLSSVGGGAGGSGSSDTGGSASSEGKFTSGFPIQAAYAEADADNGEKAFMFTDRANTLVVRTTLENHAQLASYLQGVDRVEDSIVVEVKVLSISANKSRDIGADWGLFFGRDRAGNPLFSVDLGGADVPPNNAGGNVGINGNGYPPNTTVFGDIAAGIVGGFTYSNFGYFLRDFQVSGRIALLKANNRLYDLSQPTVITKSGVPVTISSETEEPIQNFVNNGTTVSGGSTTNNNLSTGITEFRYGILLDVLATELRNGAVDLTVTPRISSKIGQKDNGQGQTLPIIQANTTTTTVTVPPGRTVALGGVLALNEERDLRETPLLSRIPLIGKYLFARTARTLTRTNVIILVTPRIIHSTFSPTLEANCDEQHLLDLAKRNGSAIIGTRAKSGVVDHPTVDPEDPNDPYDLECRERAVPPAADGKGTVGRH